MGAADGHAVAREVEGLQGESAWVREGGGIIKTGMKSLP